MEQPLFSCTKCLKSFPHSQMARSGSTCKVCTPHHSSFKQCDHCKSDFKFTVPGSICPNCQNSINKYGNPKSCSICSLQMAYGNALICHRCMHYRNKFGDPRQCQNCLQICAFYKDEVSRSKVDGTILCWVCTYNFKMKKSKERAEAAASKISSSDSLPSKNLRDTSSSNSLSAVKRQRTEDYTKHHSVEREPTTHTYSMDSAYNEHILAIGQLQDEIKLLKRQLLQKDAELLKKNQTIAMLKSDVLDIETQYRERIRKMQYSAEEDMNRIKETVRTLHREKSELLIKPKRRKSNILKSSHSAASLTLSPLRMPPKGQKFTPTLDLSVSSQSALRRELGLLNRENTPTGDSPASSQPLSPPGMSEHSDHEDSNFGYPEQNDETGTKTPESSNLGTERPDLAPLSPSLSHSSFENIGGHSKTPSEHSV